MTHLQMIKTGCVGPFQKTVKDQSPAGQKPALNSSPGIKPMNGVTTKRLHHLNQAISPHYIKS